VDKIALAWAAGLFEGEGSITHRSSHGDTSGRVPIACRLALTDEDVIRRFHKVVGVGRLYGPYTHINARDSGKPRKPHWLWATTNFEHAQVTIALFWGWLGVRRRSQAHDALRRANLPKRGPCKSDCACGRHTPKSLRRRSEAA
jgi:hypothetical protein